MNKKQRVRKINKIVRKLFSHLPLKEIKKIRLQSDFYHERVYGTYLEVATYVAMVDDDIDKIPEKNLYTFIKTKYIWAYKNLIDFCNKQIEELEKK